VDNRVVSYRDNMIEYRPATPADEPFLWMMLYLSIYVAPGAERPPANIIEKPELARYLEGWGGWGDAGLIATSNNSPVGAIWSRLFSADNAAYGFVDEDTPEIAMAVIPEFRGQGIGSRLLAGMIQQARRHFPGLSLSCDPENPAWRLYEKFGFQQVGESRTMLLRFE
jgi:ribosomal protein S18 acetylase RimI-like enzyme